MGVSWLTGKTSNTTAVWQLGPSVTNHWLSSLSFGECFLIDGYRNVSFSHRISRGAQTGSLGILSLLYSTSKEPELPFWFLPFSEKEEEEEKMLICVRMGLSCIIQESNCRLVTRTRSHKPLTRPFSALNSNPVVKRADKTRERKKERGKTFLKRKTHRFVQLVGLSKEEGGLFTRGYSRKII